MAGCGIRRPGWPGEVNRDRLGGALRVVGRSVCGALEMIQLRPGGGTQQDGRGSRARPASGPLPVTYAASPEVVPSERTFASRVEKQRSRSILTALSQRFSSTPALAGETRRQAD